MDSRGDFERFKNDVRLAIETFLAQSYRQRPETVMRRAAEYVTLEGGHRWRSLLAVAAGRVFDASALEITLPSAAGVELAHAASLVLDDLPSMDNAELRRGKSCVHLCFPRWAVDMLPAYLVNMAYRISLDNPRVSSERRVSAALELAEAGALMIEGQEEDLTHPAQAEVAEEELLKRYRHKSGMLYSTAAKAGAILCGASQSEAQLLASCGLNLGVNYQFHDDVADVIARSQDLGKPTGMDENKVTAVDLFGVAGARRKAAEFVAASLDAIGRFSAEADLLRQLVRNANWAA